MLRWKHISHIQVDQSNLYESFVQFSFKRNCLMKLVRRSCESSALLSPAGVMLLRKTAAHELCGQHKNISLDLELFP